MHARAARNPHQGAALHVLLFWGGFVTSRSVSVQLSTSRAGQADSEKRRRKKTIELCARTCIPSIPLRPNPSQPQPCFATRTQSTKSQNALNCQLCHAHYIYCFTTGKRRHTFFTFFYAESTQSGTHPFRHNSCTVSLCDRPAARTTHPPRSLFLHIFFIGAHCFSCANRKVVRCISPPSCISYSVSQYATTAPVHSLILACHTYVRSTNARHE